MSLFSSDMRVANTAAPSFQSQANVSQYGWTGADQGHYNQLIQYVDECRKIYLSLEEKIIYIEEILKEVESIDAQVKYVEQMTQAVIEAKDQTFGYATEVQDMYNEVKPMYENFVLSYTDFNTKYTDFLSKYPKTLEAAANAKVSETNAAKSAQDAADIAEELRKGQVYRGTWNMEKNASYPPKPDTNSVWDVVLNEGSIEYRFDGKLWYWGDRLLYLKDDDAYTQIEAGGSVTSVNGKKGAVTITAADVHAAPEGFGLGDAKMTALGSTSCNDAVGTGWYGINSATTDTPTGTGPSGGVLQTMKWGGGVVMQVFYNFTSDRTYTRRLNSGTWSAWVELYSTFNKPSPDAIGALNKNGDTMTGNFGLNTNSLTGANNSVIMRDYNNGNVTLSGGLKSDGTAGDLYIGHTSAVSGTAGANTRNVQLRAPMIWGATNTSIVDTAGINSEFFKGPIRTEKDDKNVYHTVVGGTDTVNRGRTIIAGGECGKHIADNIATGAEQVHIGGDDNSGVFVHTGLQTGWGTDTHKIAKFQAGELYLGKGVSQVYHQGYKPTADDVGVTNVGMGGSVVNVNDVGITDLNKIKTSGHYYTSNATDLNRPSSAAGPIVHVQGAAGYQQYVRDNNFMFRGFTGTDFKPWQTVYHTGYKPTAADVGALPIGGGKLTGSLSIAPAQGQNGVSIFQTPNTGTNAIGVSGHTADGSQIVWGSGVYYSGGNPQYAYFGFGSQPWTHGLKVHGNRVSATGTFETEAGTISANNGRFLCNHAHYPMFEMHIPGVAANAIYTQANGNMMFVQSNGSGSGVATYAQFNATVADFNGRLTSKTINRSWGGIGLSGLYVMPTNTAGNGTLESCVSMRSFWPGVYESEAMFGTYHGSDWNTTSMVLSNYNHSTGTNTAWFFRNNGTFEKLGGFALSGDGNLKGSVYGGDWITNWLARNYAPASDVNLKKIVGESVVDALGQIAKMKFHSYVWEDEGFAKETVKLNRLGVIAQEVEAIDPNYTRDIPTHNVDGEEESIKVLDTANLLALALKAIQELQAEVQDLKTQLNK